MNGNDTIVELLARLRRREPVAGVGELGRLVSRFAGDKALASALARALIDSPLIGSNPGALDEAMLDHLETLGPAGELQLTRVALLGDSRPVVVAAMEREVGFAESDDRLSHRLTLDVDHPGGDEVVAAVLEDAMRSGHRWQADAWRTWVSRSSVARECATRLVWRTILPDETHHEFRISPEDELLTADDEVATLGPKVEIPHTLDFTASALSRWGRVFADYDIVTLFSQFDRSAAEPPRSWSERDAVPIHRGADLDATLLHFLQRGWERRDEGSRAFFDRRFRDDVIATVSWHPGEREAHLIELYFATAHGVPYFLGDLPALAYSEALVALSEFRAAI